MSRNLPKILGGCGCLSLVLSAALFVGFFIVQSKDAGNGDAPVAAANTKHFKNAPAGRTGDLAANYVGFEFDYPDSWINKPQEAGGPNFVSVERQENNFTLESFNVGYFQTGGGVAGNEQLFPVLTAQLAQQFSQQFGGLQKVREGKTAVGSYEGYEGLFHGNVQDATGKPLSIFVRTILLPTTDGSKGVTLIMLGTSASPDVKQAEDLGVKGELPLILKSFRFND